MVGLVTRLDNDGQRLCVPQRQVIAEMNIAEIASGSRRRSVLKIIVRRRQPRGRTELEVPTIRDHLIRLESHRAH